MTQCSLFLTSVTLDICSRDAIRQRCFFIQSRLRLRLLHPTVYPVRFIPGAFGLTCFPLTLPLMLATSSLLMSFHRKARHGLPFPLQSHTSAMCGNCKLKRSIKRTTCRCWLQHRRSALPMAGLQIDYFPAAATMLLVCLSTIQPSRYKSRQEEEAGGRARARPRDRSQFPRVSWKYRATR